MNKLFLILLLFLFQGQIFGQKKDDAYNNIDVKHYTFNLKLNDENDVIIGKAIISALVKTPTSRVILDLAGKNSSGKGMKVSKITSEGENIPFYLIGNKLELLLPITTKAMTTYDFEIDYKGIPADGLVISKSRNGDRTFFGDNWPNRAHQWLPCKDHPSDKATVTFNITAPEHYQVVSNGIQTEETNLDGGMKFTQWESKAELPTKVMVIGVAQFAVKRTSTYNHIPVTSWVYTDDRDAGFVEYKKANEILKFYSENVGEYPYEKLANVQSKTRYGGMENASCIFYFENSVTGDETHEDLMAHEIAHQWFGNSVSEKDWKHIWLSEGFATYFTDLYFENKYGVDAMNKRLLKERETVIEFTKKQKRPVVDSLYKDINTLLNPNSYQKGAWVLHMLRNKVGDKKFWKGIQQFYSKYKGKNATTDDFKRQMESVSGISLGDFFKTWLYGTGHPNLDGKWIYKNNAVSVTVANPDKRKFPLEIGLFDKNHKLIKLQKFDVYTDLQTLFLPNVPNFDGTVVLDPNVKLLFEGSIHKE